MANPGELGLVTSPGDYQELRLATSRTSPGDSTQSGVLLGGLT
ncbi:hypothetical protein A2U01_0054742 [Trifolium medium]|uniref:Uncharacterized protein n=1 Tax=Trifolium medium TaxID=97028 RepID=A0A392RD70_9FABA|nr:hypothetical protein [Trifolium medium]